MDPLISPSARENYVGDPHLEARLRAALGVGAISHGWLIVGPSGSGKATLAYRLARAILDPGALKAGQTLDMDTAGRTFRLVAGGSHPDLFAARRRYDEKEERLETEIAVETVRGLISFMNRTPALGGWRVAIIDTADELNRFAANALLKVLEEPPARTAIFLLSAAPGRLLATIRSRCRRIELRPAPDEAIRRLLQTEAGVGGEDAATILRAARGRPGYALTLAAGEGGEAISAAEEFLRIAVQGGDIQPIASSVTGRAGNARWELFLPRIFDVIEEAARKRARGAAAPAPFESADPARLAEARASLGELALRGDALNVDRAQLLQSMRRRLAAALGERAA